MTTEVSGLENVGEEVEVINERVANAEVPPDSISEYCMRRDHYVARYGHLFKTAADCEDFHMLPLSKKQKDHVLRRALELNREQKE